MVVGEADVDGMLDRLTPHQMDEWIAYDMIEPIGLVRQNRMIALITAALISSKDHQVDIDQLYPMGGEPSEKHKPLSPRATLARFQSAQAAANRTALGVE